jgi:hypothetical protein
MNTQIFVAIITVAGSILIASLTFYLNERSRRSAKWQQKKLDHYQQLMLSISGLVVDGPYKDKTNENFSLACNTSALFASQEVVTALMRFHDEIKLSNPHRTQQGHDRLLKVLLLAIRRDIGLSRKDHPRTFEFHLMAPLPKNK